MHVWRACRALHRPVTRARVPARRLLLPGLLACSRPSTGRQAAATATTGSCGSGCCRRRNFLIYYHQREEASRPAARGDRSKTCTPTLDWRLRAQIRGRTHVILVDQHDLANGWATPLPYNTIEIAATRRASRLGRSATPATGCDWFSFTSTRTSCISIDPRGWAAASAASSAGRRWLFPNLYCRTGRSRGSPRTTRAARRARAGSTPATSTSCSTKRQRAGRFEPLDRVNGGLVDWPGGTRAVPVRRRRSTSTCRSVRRARHSRARRFDGRLAARIFFVDRALPRYFRAVGTMTCGATFRRPCPCPGCDGAAAGAAHASWLSGQRAAVGSWPGAGGAVLDPLAAWLPGHRARRRSAAADTEHLSSRYLGERLSVGDEVIVFDQMELVRDVALQADLYVARRDGRPTGDAGVTRLTRHGRVGDPDLAPDGRTIACVVTEAGRRSLALIRLADDLRTRAEIVEPALWRSEPDAEYLAPRWSPDGRTIAVARRRRDGASELVLVDPQRSNGARRPCSPVAERRADHLARLGARLAHRAFRYRRGRRSVQPARNRSG